MQLFRKFPVEIDFQFLNIFSFPHSLKDVPSHASTNQKMAEFKAKSLPREGALPSTATVLADDLLENVYGRPSIPMKNWIHFSLSITSGVTVIVVHVVKGHSFEIHLGYFSHHLFLLSVYGDYIFHHLMNWPVTLRFSVACLHHTLYVNAKIIYVNESGIWLILGNFNPDYNLSSFKDSPYDSLCFGTCKDSTNIITCWRWLWYVTCPFSFFPQQPS